WARDARSTEYPECHEPVGAHRRDGVWIEERGTGAVEVRRHAHRQVALILQDVEVVVEALLRDIKEVVAEMHRVRRRAQRPERSHDLGYVALVGERSP